RRIGGPWIEGGQRVQEVPAEPTAEADRGRHPAIPSFKILAGGPGSLGERSATKGRADDGLAVHPSGGGLPLPGAGWAVVSAAPTVGRRSLPRVGVRRGDHKWASGPVHRRPPS